MDTKKQIFITLCALLFVAPATAFATTISLQTIPKNIGVGDTVRVDILLDSAVPTNAFSGTVSYSKTLEPTAISDGNSIVSLWIIHPAVPVAEASIPFAGITPGGFSGNNGILFSILFRAKAAGTAHVSLGDIQVLRNDGSGDKESVTTKQLVLSVGSRPSGGYVEPADIISPEPFTASLSVDPQLFDGQSYLVFMAVDKGSGVDHYAVAESRVPSFLLPLFPLSWKTATSPYALIDQNLTSTVYINAVDRAGNGRLSIYPPHHLFTAYEKVVLVVILTIVVLLYWRGRGRRFRKDL